MASADDATPYAGQEPKWFVTTHWSTVLAATQPGSPQASQALEQLCQAYWYPLYAYLRSKGLSPDDAADLVQAFFLALLEKNRLAQVDPSRGKFRAFLLTCLRTFQTSDWRRAHAQKRGGTSPLISLDQVQVESLCRRDLLVTEDPEQIYERCWALTILERVENRLRKEYSQRGKADRFRILEQFLVGDKQDSFAATAAELNLNESTLRSDIHRFRKRFRTLLRQEVANTVASPEQIDEEVRGLIAALRRRPSPALPP